MISHSSLYKIIHRLYVICKSMHVKDIDPNMDRGGSTSIEDDFSGKSFGYQMFGKSDGVLFDICRLLGTPRHVKYVMRSVYSSWARLHGEVNLDQLFVFHVLRSGSPEMFRFIVSNLDEIRGLSYEGVSNDRKPRRDALNSRISDILSLDPSRHGSSYRLTCYLFDNLKDDPDLFYRSSKTRQSVSYLGETDYFDRMLRGEMASNEISDQKVLSEYRNVEICFKSDSAIPISILDVFINDKEYSQKFEYLIGGIFDARVLKFLLEGIVKRSLSLLGVSASSDDVPGFLSIWRLLKENMIGSQGHDDWVVGLISYAASYSLRHANDIYYWFSGRAIYGSKGEINPVRERFVEIVRGKVSVDNGFLISVLDKSYIYSCYHFSFLFSDVKHGGVGFDAREWRWFFDALIDSALLSPQIIVPHISVFLVDEKHDFDSFSYEFLLDKVDLYFPARSTALFNVLALDIDFSFLEPRERNRVLCAVEYARRVIPFK